MSSFQMLQCKMCSAMTQEKAIWQVYSPWSFPSPDSLLASPCVSRGRTVPADLGCVLYLADSASWNIPMAGGNPEAPKCVSPVRAVDWNKGRLPGSHTCAHTWFCHSLFSLRWSFISKFGSGPKFGVLMPWVSFVFAGHELPQKGIDKFPWPVISVTHPHYPPVSRQQGPSATSLPAPGEPVAWCSGNMCARACSPCFMLAGLILWQNCESPLVPGTPGDKTPVWNKKRLGKCWVHSLLPHWEQWST